MNQSTKETAKINAIEAAHKIARETGIAGYAVETFDGWIASDKKPSLRFGKVFECRIDGKTVHA